MHSIAALLIFILVAKAVAFRPVVIIHGVWDQKGSLKILTDQIKQVHPGTEVYTIDILHGIKSVTPMWYQVKRFYTKILPVMNAAPNGINLIGYSQGGLISRGIVETMEHNIVTFISLSSPQAGQYGDKFLRLIFPNYFKESVYKIFYSQVGQECSVANYWNDPYYQDLYFQYSNFLPLINNELSENYNDAFRNNFLKLDRLVLIGGPDDEVITPWQSSHFGFFDKNETVIEMRDRDIYKLDLFGLKTLDRLDKLRIFEVSGVNHSSWHNNITIIRKFIIPWLD